MGCNFLPISNLVLHDLDSLSEKEKTERLTTEQVNC